jgi:hypothetical protein
MSRKTRSDSKLAKLAPEQKEMLQRWLVEENISYAKAKDRLFQDFNIETSEAALFDFYRRECFSLRSSQAKQFAEHVVATLAQDGDNYDQATMAIIRQRAFETAYMEQVKVEDKKSALKDLVLLGKMIGDTRKQAFREKQLEFNKEKFRQQIKTDVENGLDALLAEIREDPIALELFEKFKARVMTSMGGKAA